MPNFAIILAHFPKMNASRFRKIRGYFGTLEKMATVELDDLVKLGWEVELAHEFITWREAIDREKIFKRLEEENIAAITIDDPEYPYLLKEIPDFPGVLFVRGNANALNKTPTVAVVGTRKSTSYGQQVTEQLVSELAGHGITIISGLALGIDGIAHRAALDVGGLTIAVLGSGVDAKTVTPREHWRLAERIIAEGGALVSEYPPDFAPTAYSFPERNRIIAGLSQATLVIEAPEQSGALITAKAALEYNREVMAIPHPITSPTGVGANKLLQRGALVVQTAADILDALQLPTILPTQRTSELPLNLSINEERVWARLTRDPISIDALVKDLAAPSTEVMGALTLLELKGLVKNMGGMRFVKV